MSGWWRLPCQYCVLYAFSAPFAASEANRTVAATASDEPSAHGATLAPPRHWRQWISLILAIAAVAAAAAAAVSIPGRGEIPLVPTPAGSIAAAAAAPALAAAAASARCTLPLARSPIR